MKWCRIKLEINVSAAEAAAEILREAGAEGVILEESDSRVELTAYYPDDFSPVVLRDRIYGLVNFGLKPGEILFAVKYVQDEKWKNVWKQYITPVKVGKEFIICPEDKEYPESKRKIIKLIPGMAFGLGGHESTQLALILLEEFADPERLNMLDAGCGTGILSLAAAKMGQRKITAVDIAEPAVRACRKNMMLNRINENIITVYKQDIAEIEGEFSLITTNLLSRYLMPLLPHLVECLSPEGVIILAGFLKYEETEFISRVENLGLKILMRKSLRDWGALAAGGV